MSSIMLLEKDPFVEAVANTTALAEGSDFPVRRPILGLIPKKGSFAYISLKAMGDGGLTPISIFDSSGPAGANGDQGYSNANHNFFLTSVDIKRQEKAQIIETFGQEYAFFFGESAQFINFGGMLVNTADFNWKNEWLRNYDTYLRGTRCVEMKARVFVGFDDVVVSGYILNTALNMHQESPYVCPFQFGMLVTDYTDLSAVDTSSVLKNSSQVRRYGNQAPGGPLDLDGAAGEYMTAPNGANVALYDYDVSTGKPKQVKTVAATDSPASVEAEHTAAWLGGGRGRTPESALREISVQSYMQQNGVDRTTSILAHAASPGDMSLGKRSDNSEGITKALGRGTGNFCGVIDDEKTSS